MVTNKVPGLPKVRRVVTGHDLKGRSKVIWDGLTTKGKKVDPASVSTILWSIDKTPADIPIGESIKDTAEAQEFQLTPNGTKFMISEFEPGVVGVEHRTNTIDFVVVMSGEVDMDLDDSTVNLKAGDVVIQRGTNHTWCNRGAKPSRVAFIMMAAKPLGIGKTFELK